LYKCGGGLQSFPDWIFFARGGCYYGKMILDRAGEAPQISRSGCHAVILHNAVDSLVIQQLKAEGFGGCISSFEMSNYTLG
jgi:hypothetical protein